MGQKRKIKKEAQLIMEAFIKVITEDVNFRDTGGSVSEELSRGYRKKRD